MTFVNIEYAISRIKTLGLYDPDSQIKEIIPALDGIVFHMDNGVHFKCFTATGRVIQYTSTDWRTHTSPIYDSEKN